MRLLLALCLLVSLPARADDRPDFAGECHPPVIGVIDPDWRREAQRFKDGTLLAFGRFLDPDGARRELRAALSLAESTRGSAYDIIQLTRELLIRGLRGKDLEATRALALDAQTTLGADGAARFVRAILALRAKSSLSVDDLKDLDELLGKNLVRETLGRRLGLRGDPEALREAAAQRLRDGTLDGATASAAARDALLRAVSQNQPGDAARAGLATCITTMSRTCLRKDAEEHCKSTPREYLDLLQK